MFMSWPVSLRSTRKPKTGQYKTRLCSKRFYLILIFCFSVIWQWVQIVRITGYAEEKEIVILGPDSIDKAVTKTNLVNNTNVVDSSNNIKKESNRRRQPWQTCEIVKGFEGINRIQVFNDTNLSVKRPRIYCFMMTQSSRKRRFQAVFNTWGRKCDHLLIASDKSNPKLNTVKMKTNSTYKDLWNKLNETLQYISDTTNEFQDYDWYFKVDDDTFVIIENLIKFLTSQEVQAKSRDNLPLIYGRRFAWPILKALKFFPTFFGQESQQNQQFKDLFYDKVKEGERLIYPSGGAGYIMNRQYATLLLSTFKSKQTLRGIPDEDMAVAINMLYVGVRVQGNSVDDQGLQLFHPELPGTMYNIRNNTVVGDWLIGNHLHLGGIASGDDCCSPYSISFHHAKPMHIRYMQYKFYQCKVFN